MLFVINKSKAMTLKQLKVVVAHAIDCKVALSYERTGYYFHTVIIRGRRYDDEGKATAIINRLTTLLEKSACKKESTRKT